MTFFDELKGVGGHNFFDELKGGGGSHQFFLFFHFQKWFSVPNHVFS